MKMALKLLLICCLLSACSNDFLKELREEDIKKYGISIEIEKLLKVGITGVSVDKEGNIHFYVSEIKPDTKKIIDDELINIFGQKFDYILHEDKQMYP
ncbi:hypothetical protein [Halobacillus litoralis]|uniref:hypothetical protein n=1 Tax=Halobacillus litoralis TaxID=45668 RepID=UPI001CFF4B94|nr:hypothetical protein [Halobacillus litoralis]